MRDMQHNLSSRERETLHNASMHILQEVGVHFLHPEALAVFTSHGFRTDGDTVFFTEKQVLDALAAAPSQFDLSARDPHKSRTVGTGRPVCIPGYGCPFVVSPNGTTRPGTLADYIAFCKLVHTSPQIDMTGFLMVEPSDVPKAVAPLEMLYANMTISDKPFMGPVVPRSAALDALEMAAILWGGRDRLAGKYVMLPTINPISPLKWDHDMAVAIVEYARHGQPIMFENLMMAGSTGPVSLAGTIALQNAEILSGIVLAQLITPGLPVVFGCLGAATDMQTGNLSVGAPEGAMLTAVTAQMARHYGVPGRSGGAITDAHVPDIQAGIESTLSLYTAIRGGTDIMLHACGIQGAYMAMSFEKFVLDEEVIAMLRRMMQPIRIDEETLDLATIKEVGIGGEYLSHERTLSGFRTHLHPPHLMNRQSCNDWFKAPQREVLARAAATVRARLEAYTPPPLDPAVRQELNAFMTRKRNA